MKQDAGASNGSRSNCVFRYAPEGTPCGRLRRILMSALACMLLLAAARMNAADPLRLRSPDGTNVIELIGIDDPANGLQLKISRNDRPLIDILSLAVRLAEGGELSGAAKLQRIEQSTIEETITLPWGKAKEVLNRCARASVHLIDAHGTQWDLELAAYNDGVAYRYGLPEQKDLAQFTLTAESGNLQFTGMPQRHYTAFDRFTNDHEAEFHRDELTGVTGPLVDLPVLAVWPDGHAAAMTEARVRDFPNLYLEPDPNPDSDLFHTRLSPLPDKSGACVAGRTPHTSPWRVILLGECAGRLLESNLLLCLNDPPSGDFSWAKPGKTTWPWWNGTFDRGPAFVPGMNLETHKRYIDFCAENGIAYHAVVSDTRPWHLQAEEGFAPHKDTDITTPRPELQFPELLTYARERGVGIRLWVHWKALDARLEQAFQRYEDWGISGLMIDFLDRDDQEMVRFCERVLESASRHRLHIQFHGSYKPSGEQRTFPCLFNREGVLNLEYLKWSKRCTPPHDVEAAYVRQLAGPLDYHIGGFRAISSQDFMPRNENPYVLGTRCHQLAMYVIFDNPMPMVTDTPEAYKGQPGFQFIVEVPTTWDESRFIAGTAGDYIVMARRSGATWYLAGMTDWTARELTIPLAFLAPGTHTARLYADGSMNQDEPNAIRQETKTVDASASLPVALASGGGFAAILAPAVESR